ncbi:MAG: aldo/keto reductase [Acidobacteria bacterium]|nr:aldo/keto reductase [Acidobacteriota bacterium]
MAPLVPRVALSSGYTIPRLIKGGWQLAGGHGEIDRGATLDDMNAFVTAGMTSFDCADIYTGVEALIGDFVRARGGPDGLQLHTKYVPDLAALGSLTAEDVAAAIDRSRARLGVDVVDLVQFHWWDYERPGMLETAAWLHARQRAGAIRHLALTNCNTMATQAIVDAGVPVVAHQVQYSLLDQRPAGPMTRLAAVNGIGLLCYGALAGGFLSERFLGKPAPVALANRSLVKYRLVIDEFGGWERFQRLLAVLADVATRHGVSMGTVAVAWVLAQPQVAGVIVGARNAAHLSDTILAASLTLDGDDLAALGAVLAEGEGVTGDVYDLEREKGGQHAAIMRYDLNAQAGPGPGLRS